MKDNHSIAPALALSHVVKRYGKLTAVNDISLAVPAGEFFGFLGPNGAGKTTTINAIVGLARLDGGTISVFGHDNARDWRAARRCIGLSPQEYNFDRYLNIRDILLYQAGYYGLRPRDVSQRADDLLEQFGLTQKARDPISRLSGGMRRRLTLARALIHSPKLLILDEPTAGVDVELRLELWDFLRRINSQGITVFLTTHYLEEAEALCRRIAIIESGRIAALDTTQSLLSRERETTLTVTVDKPVMQLADELLARGAQFRSGEVRISFSGTPPEELASTLALVEAAGFRIEQADFKRKTLQDIFLELTRR